MYLLTLVLCVSSVYNVLGCAPDVKFKGDHHRKKELEDKFVHNLVELKDHEDVLLKAVEALKKAQAMKEEDEIDYKTRISEIEKELKATKEDHARLIQKHESYLLGADKPKTWGDTISKWTGDAFGRIVYNVICGAAVILIPMLIRPFQRRWLAGIRSGPTIEEVSDDDSDGMRGRISTEEVKQILNREYEKDREDKKQRRKAVKAE